MLVLGIYNACCCSQKEKALSQEYVEDPRLQILGMTPLFHHGGFTLIELLVVVLIIGILAAVAVPQYQKVVIKSRFATIKNLTHALAQAEELYFLANGEYTTEIDLLDANFSQLLNKIEGVAGNKRYYFDWGFCTLMDGTSDKEPRVMCETSEANLKYGIHLHNVPADADVSVKEYAGRIRCRVIDTTAPNANLASKICQQETGTEPISGNYYY